jgi:hypothetical protein
MVLLLIEVERCRAFRSRRAMSTTVDSNSLCQFWKD